MRRYDILFVGSSYRLVRKKKNSKAGGVKFIASLEEIYGIVKACHEATGHMGGKRTIAEVKKCWANVTQEACYLYISSCEYCNKMKYRKTRSSRSFGEVGRDSTGIGR